MKIESNLKRTGRSKSGIQLERIKNLAYVNDRFLLLPQNIFPKAKVMQRKENIAYLDIAGNFTLAMRTTIFILRET
ncbi:MULTISPECIES: hypothetical protein [Sphingobacterium]|uniref:hypothetical protein n=1 Tax=Sphingobacterium TaxID=28453 RepID=UPI0038FCBF9E